LRSHNQSVVDPPLVADRRRAVAGVRVRLGHAGGGLADEAGDGVLGKRVGGSGELGSAVRNGLRPTLPVLLGTTQWITV